MDNNSNIKAWVFHSHSYKDYEKVLNSESGSFYIDQDGIAQRFEPSIDNPFIEEESEKNANYTFKANKSIRTVGNLKTRILAH